jgi:hypothetical protein
MHALSLYYSETHRRVSGLGLPGIVGVLVFIQWGEENTSSTDVGDENDACDL